MEGIRVRWDVETASYRVDRPNWDGGEVVMRADADARIAQLQAELERLRGQVPSWAPDEQRCTINGIRYLSEPEHDAAVAQLAEERAKREKAELQTARNLALVERSLESDAQADAVRRETGGNAPEQVQGILDSVIALRAELAEYIDRAAGEAKT